MIGIADVLNRLQKHLKENDIIAGQLVPTGVTIDTNGNVVVQHNTGITHTTTSLGKAAQYIHHRLDELG